MDKTPEIISYKLQGMLERERNVEEYHRSAMFQIVFTLCTASYT